MLLCNELADHIKIKAVRWPLTSSNLAFRSAVTLAASDLKGSAILVGPKTGPYNSATYLSSTTWQQLQCLSVEQHDSLYSTELMQQLSINTWPALTRVELNDLGLDHTHVAQLVQGPWPALEVLELMQNKLDATAAIHLASSEWPDLRQLYLCGNKLDNTAISHIVKGSWPRLETLWLHANSFDERGLHILVEGEWNLHQLTLGTAVAGHRAASLLGLWPQSIIDWFSHPGPFEVHRNTVNNPLWPNLHEICFVPSGFGFKFVCARAALKFDVQLAWFVSLGIFFCCSVVHGSAQARS